MWFAQSEAQFALRDITEDTTKYYYVVVALGSLTAGRVVSIPEHVQRIERPAVENIRLLSLNGFEDSKPLELMGKMVARLGKHEPDFLFIELFLQQLLLQVRAALCQHHDYQLSGVGRGGR